MSVPFDRAEAYRAAGWSGTLAFEAQGKWPPPTGFTGYDGRWPLPADLEHWRAEGRANIGLRLPRGVIGIDVDCHSGKPGAETLAGREAEWGALPPTWTSTSRTDGSGIRLYRYSHRECPVPDDAWPGEAGPAVELIRFSHRYAMVWPSVHPGGDVYRWIRPDGSDAGGEIPSPGDPAELPAAWLEGLTGFSPNGKHDPTHVRPGSRAEQRTKLKPAREWLRRLPRGEPCAYVGRLAADALAAARREEGSAYEHTRDAVLALLRAAEVGHPGVINVLAHTKDEYVAVVAEKRGGEAVARAEFDRFTEFGAAKVLAGPSERAGTGCDCAPAPSKNSPESGPVAQPDFGERDLTHDGLALEIGDRWPDARYVDAWGRWLFFTGSHWQMDETLVHMTRCRAFLRDIAEKLERLADETEDEKRGEQLRRAAKTLRSAPTVAQVIGLARSNTRQAAGVEQWDRSPLHMGTPNTRRPR